MPRVKKLDRPTAIQVWLPNSLVTQLRQELYSEVEGRIPHGALSELWEVLITRWLTERRANRSKSNAG